MSAKYAIFYSPALERGAQLPLLQDALQSFNLSAVFYPVQKCSELASKLDADVLVAAGGDGTVNSVASQAYRLDKPLGVVPLGTLNHFAKDIALPLVLLQAVELIARGNTTKIDIGLVNDKVFLNNSSIGIYPTIVRTRSRLEKRIGKWPAVLVSIFLVANRRLHLYKIKMTLDGKPLEKKSSLLFVGNNSYSLKGFGLPDRHDLWHGKLHVFVLKTKRVDRLIKTAFYGLLGKRLPEHYVERFEGRSLKVVLSYQKHVWVAYDGEIEKMSSHLEFKLQPKVLSVITSQNKK